MNQYPSFTFRLTVELLRQVDVMAQVRRRTRGQVVREALEFYFANRFKTPPRA